MPRNVWTWTRHKGKVCWVLVGSAILLSLAVTGIWIWHNDEIIEIGELPFEEEYDESHPGCVHISKNLDEFWGCLVEGPRYFYSELLQRQPGVNMDKSDKWGVVPLKKRELSLKEKINTKKPGKRIRKRSVLSQSEFGGPYAPIDPRYVWDAKPLPYSSEQIRDNPTDLINDPYYKGSISPYLYTFDGNNLKQQQPPWSYDGEFGPKKWHELELEKFLVPVNPNIGPQDSKSALTKLIMASLRDHWAEKAWKEPLFRAMWNFSTPFVFGDREAVPIHIWNFNDSDPDRFDTHVPNDPNSGFYSSTRFLLPPPIEFAKLKDYKEKKLLPFNFKMPLSTHQDYLKLPNLAYELEQKRAAGKPLYPAEEKNKVHVELLKNVSQVLTGIFGQGVNESLVAWRKGSEVLTDKRLSFLEKRAHYSLPLMPVPYPICQHSEPSPMNIIRKNAVRSSIKPYIFSENVNVNYRMLMEFPEDGTNLLQVKLWESNRLTKTSVVMTGGAVTGSELHFEVMFIRFGIDKNSGSEHRLDGKAYAMELQLLFSYRGPDLSQPYYRTLARQQNDLFPFREKLVIMLSVLVEVKPKNEVKDPHLFEPLAQVAYKFRQQEETNPNGKNRSRGFLTDDYILRLADFIPGGEFYLYRGGLTFPPCFSYVVWSVYNKTLNITEDQYKELKLIPAIGRSDSQFVAGNIRPIKDEWVPNEHVPGITPAEQEKLQELRYSRTILKSLNIESNNLSEVYDYDYDYDGASEQSVTFGLVVFFQLVVIFISNV